MTITTVVELIERLEDIKADIASGALSWVLPHLDDLLDDCRDVADDEEAASGRATGV